jgi:hypothetical protein
MVRFEPGGHNSALVAPAVLTRLPMGVRPTTSGPYAEECRLLLAAACVQGAAVYGPQVAVATVLKKTMSALP